MASPANQLSPTNPKKRGSIGVLCLIITLYAYSFKLEISALSLIAENVISLKIKPAVIPLIVMMLAFFVLIYGIYQRMHGDISEKSMRRGLFVVIGCFPLFLITWWIYSWQLSDKLESERLFHLSLVFRSFTRSSKNLAFRSKLLYWKRLFSKGWITWMAKATAVKWKNTIHWSLREAIRTHAQWIPSKYGVWAT